MNEEINILNLKIDLIEEPIIIRDMKFKDNLNLMDFDILYDTEGSGFKVFISPVLYYEVGGMPARLYGGTKFVFNVKNRALFHNVENESTINLFDQLATISYFHLQSALYFYFADKLQDKPPSGLLTRFGSAELRGVLSKHFSQNPLFHRKWDG